MSGIKALEIELEDVSDLARIVAVIRGSSSFLLSFPGSPGGHILGTYLHPVADNLSATFPYVKLEDKPEPVIGFASDVSGKERLEHKRFSESGYLSIPVAYSRSRPHSPVPPEDVKCSASLVSVEDISSIARLAVSTVSEDLLPFVWYDLSREKYVLAVKTEGSNEVDGGLMIFDSEGPKPGDEVKYIKYSLKGNVEKVDVSDGVDDYSARFVAVIRTKRLPYLDFPGVSDR